MTTILHLYPIRQLLSDNHSYHLRGVFLDALRDLMQSGTYAWGATALVYMYDNLNEASKSTVRQLAGYITLLKVSSNVMIFFHWHWLLYVVSYFNEYVCKIYLVLDLRTFLIHWFRPSYRGLRREKTVCMPMDLRQSIACVDVSQVSGQTDPWRSVLDSVWWPPFI